MTDSWRQNAATLARTGLMSWRQIADIVGKPKSTVSDYLRQHPHIPTPLPDKVEPDAKEEHDNSRILFISDMHIPYHNKGLLPFLRGLKARYKPTRVVILGDEVDHHAISFHDSDPDLDSAGPELRKALPVIKEIEELFPVADVIESNHGSLAYRRAKSHGIPRHYIKPYNEVLGVGAGWKWHEDLVLDLPDGQKVYVHHGKTSEAIKTSQLMGMSHVSGHYHESFGVKYWSNPQGLYFGINAGCLIDPKSLAFAYNKINPKRPIIGTALIIDGVPVLEAMQL